MLLALQPHSHKTTGTAYCSFKCYLLGLPTFENKSGFRTHHYFRVTRQESEGAISETKRKKRKQTQTEIKK